MRTRCRVRPEATSTGSAPMRRPSMSNAVLPDERTSWTSRPEHGCNQFQSGDLGDRSGMDSPTVTKDGHLVTEFEYLIQVVAHIEKCHTVVTEDSNDPKQLLDLVGFQ